MATNGGERGLGFFGALTILFIGLKLTGHIDWEWWWVLSPLWISAAIGLITMFILWLWWLVRGRYHGGEFSWHLKLPWL